MVAELQVRICVEFALREKAQACAFSAPKQWSMRKLIERAIKER